MHTGIDSELVKDVPEMRMNSVRGDEELFGYLPICATMRDKIGDHQLGFGQCLPPGLRPIDFGDTPSHAETAKPAPNACSVPARPDARRNGQRLVECGDRRGVVAVLRKHPAEVFERGRVGKRARSVSIERNRTPEIFRGIAPDASGVCRCRSTRRDIWVEGRTSFSERDSVFCQLLVTDRCGDADAFGIVGDLVRVKREHRESLLMSAGAEPFVCLHRVSLGQ
jgi:hypothetical protein